jgi:formylglycine-generating enzyme required for sulfatase activity
MPDEPRPPDDASAPAARSEASVRRSRRPGVEQLFEALATTAAEQAKLVTNTAGMKLVLIPAGTFMMGSAAEEALHRLNELPRHEVAITQPFYMSVHLVTQGQYEQVMRTNPARFNAAGGGDLNHPVERISWDDAMEFCRRLSALPEEKQAGRTYRLPTEAEWEYACRAGTPTPFSFGPALTGAQANFDANFPAGDSEKARPAGRTMPVGSYAANNFGLHDMHGNLWEWCGDWYDGGYYRASPRRDPPGPATGRFRVVRGGAWRNHAATCRAAYRNALVPNNRDPYTGFRVVMTAGGAR